eukprot:632413-Ditylum_brightwellii.AAC.1
MLNVATVEMVLKREMPPVLQTKEEVDKKREMVWYARMERNMGVFGSCYYYNGWNGKKNQVEEIWGKNGVIFLQIVSVLHIEMTLWRRK